MCIGVFIQFGMISSLRSIVKVWPSSCRIIKSPLCHGSMTDFQCHDVMSALFWPLFSPLVRNLYTHLCQSLPSSIDLGLLRHLHNLPAHLALCFPPGARRWHHLLLHGRGGSGAETRRTAHSHTTVHCLHDPTAARVGWAHRRRHRRRPGRSRSSAGRVLRQ